SIRPRARDRVHDGAGAVALRRAVVGGLNAELLQRVGKWERLVLLEVRVGMARAVETERYLPRLRAVGREPQRAWNRFPRLLIDRRQHHARHQRAQLRGVAAVQRQLDDPFRIDDFGDRRRGDVDRGRLARYGNGLRNRADFNREAHREVFVGLQQDAFALRRPEPGQLRADV